MEKTEELKHLMHICLNEKCTKGENNTKNIIIWKGNVRARFYCEECKRTPNNLPLYCSNEECKILLTRRGQRYFCCNSCKARVFFKVPWNKGLTKETDLRIAKAVETTKQSIKNIAANKIRGIKVCNLLRNKTWEEVRGDDAAKKMKEQYSLRTSSTGNPAYGKSYNVGRVCSAETIKNKG